MTVHTGDTIHRLHWGEQHGAGDLHRKHNLVVQHKEAVRLYCTRVTKEVPRN